MERNKLQDMLDYRNLANTDPIKLIQLQNQMEMPMVNRAIGGQLNNQMDGMKNKIDMVGPLALSNLVDIGLGKEAAKDFKEMEERKQLEQLLAEQEQANVDTGLLQFAGPQINNMMAQGQALEQGKVPAKTGGGLMQLAIGGNPMPTRKFSGPVQGDGHGMEDNVFMPIKDRGEQVATLAVSPKEYVVDAHTMSALGNGNPDAGAKVMDRVVDNVREKAYGTDQQPNEISGLAALRPMMERI
jgi:hypothetical protein